MAGLAGSRISTREKLAIGFFGIRGIGLLDYLSHGLNEAEVEQARLLWALMHGITASPVMGRIESLTTK